MLSLPLNSPLADIDAIDDRGAGRCGLCDIRFPVIRASTVNQGVYHSLPLPRPKPEGLPLLNVPQLAGATARVARFPHQYKNATVQERCKNVINTRMLAGQSPARRTLRATVPSGQSPGCGIGCSRRGAVLGRPCRKDTVIEAITIATST